MEEDLQFKLSTTVKLRSWLYLPLFTITDLKMTHDIFINLFVKLQIIHQLSEVTVFVCHPNQTNHSQHPRQPKVFFVPRDTFYNYCLVFCMSAFLILPDFLDNQGFLEIISPAWTHILSEDVLWEREVASTSETKHNSLNSENKTERTKSVWPKLIIWVFLPPSFDRQTSCSIR